MLHSRKFCLNDLNPHLLCVLCGGYFVDATTIIECLHSFCKTCIVRYLETSKYCPICDVQVHKTKPLQNIRSDRTLQDIVYKLVPGLFQREMQLRRQFYSDHPEVAASSREDAGDALDSYYFYSADDQVSLSLQYAISASSSVPEEFGKRYLRCPAAVTIAHLQKLLRAKHGLSNEHRVDICHEASQPLSDSLSLMDVAYIFQWQRKRPMQLFYQIYDLPAKRRKLNNDDSSEHMTSTVSSVATPVEIKPKSPVPDAPPAVSVPRVTEEPSGEPWKEVQLQISETGIMKAVAQGKETIISSGRVESPPTTSSETEKPANNVELPKESVQPNQKIEASDINGNKKEILPVVTNAPPSTSSVTILPITTSSKPCAMSPATSVPLRKEPITNEQKDVKVQSLSTNIVPTKDDKSKQTKPLVNKEHKDLKSEPVPTIPIKASPTPMMKKPTSSSVGYKTLKLPPKSWNPSVSRGSYMATHSSLSKSSPMPIAPKQEVDVADTSRPPIVPVQNKPPRFFKERDRPRFLGNPVSGVKPMYQIQSDIPSRPNASTSSMVKIDPKTLSPMTSKAPSTSHNNNHLLSNSVTSSTGTITTTTASSKFSSKSSTTSMPPLPPVLHPPPNPLLYNYPGLINSPLMRPPIIHSNSPHHFPPYSMPQAMFYGSQSPRFPPHSLPAVQRVPANMHPQKSPPMPTTTTHVPTSTITSHKPEVPKVNGEIAATDKSAKNESATEKLEDVAKPQTKNASIPQSVSNGSNSTDVNKLSNGSSSNNETFESSSKQALKVKSVDSNEKCTTSHPPEPSKSVPPASPAQNTS